MAAVECAPKPLDARETRYNKGMAKKIFGVERNVFFLGLVSLFNDVSGEMVVSVFPAFFQSVLKSGAASLGLVEGVAEGLANFIKIFSGRLSDRVQKRKIFAVLGYALSTLTRPLYIFATLPAHALGIRVADRVGKGLREAPRDALLSLSVPRKELGRSFGFHRAMDAFGSVLGPLGAFLLLRIFPEGFNHIFISAFFLGVCAVLAFVFVREVNGVIERREQFAVLRTYPRQFWLFLLIMTLLSVGSIPVAVLTLRSQEAGLDISFIPLLYMLYNASFTLFSTYGGRAADYFGERMVIFLGYAVLCSGYLFILYDNTFIALLSGFALLGLSNALTDGTQRSYIAKLTGRDERGGAYGLFNAATGAGVMLSGILGGFLWQRFGSALALVSALIIVLCGLALLLFNRHGGSLSR